MTHLGPLTLGVETSCDETAVALYRPGQGLLAEAVFSQTDLHALYGGVVPELAARDHITRLLPMLRQLLAEQSLALSQIDSVAYTAGPGLAGGLLVGASVATALGWALDCDTIGVNHLEGHVLSPLLSSRMPPFPWLTLLVSGGHSLLVQVKAAGVYEVLGTTLDDAVGEAFDKTAKLLGLPYPGGAHLSALAREGCAEQAFFKPPMQHHASLDFSFSGLKTAVRQRLQTAPELAPQDVAAGFERAAVASLCQRLAQAITTDAYRALVLVGGVAANQHLRAQVAGLAQAREVPVFYPPLAHCTDNAAMIALCGALRVQAGQRDVDRSIQVRARWPLTALSAFALGGGLLTA